MVAVEVEGVEICGWVSSGKVMEQMGSQIHIVLGRLYLLSQKMRLKQTGYPPLFGILHLFLLFPPAQVATETFTRRGFFCLHLIIYRVPQEPKCEQQVRII